MDYSEALKLFGFTSNFTKEELKKRYLELSKKYHPDLNGDEEMMKKINSAYEVLKSHSVSSDLVKYYDSLKERLKFFASKTVYLPDTLEFKYAKEIDEVIEKFNFNMSKSALDLFYNVILDHIKDIFAKYKKEVLKNVPVFFVSKFEPINDDCSFDDYVKKVNEIRNKYEKIDKGLNQIILSMFKDKNVNSKILEEIFDVKEIIIKEIIDKKITLDDGIYKLQAEIKTRILKIEALNNKIWNTYKAIMNNFNKRMKELNPTDIEDIDVAMKAFNKAMATALYYYENAGCYIVLTKNNEIIIVRYNKFDSLSPFVTDIASRTYKDKQVLYDKIYNSFLKNKKNVKIKDVKINNNEKNILKREKNK